MCLQNKSIQDNDKPETWVGISNLRYLYIYMIFLKRTPEVDENKASVTDNTEEEENSSKKTADDADEYAEKN